MQEIWKENDNDMAKMRKWQQIRKNRRRIVFLLFMGIWGKAREGLASANQQIDAMMYDVDAELQSYRNLPEDEKDQDTKVK